MLLEPHAFAQAGLAFFCMTGVEGEGLGAVGGVVAKEEGLEREGERDGVGVSKEGAGG